MLRVEVVQAAIVLASIDSDHPLILRRLAQAFPGIRLVCCTTAGEFSSDFGFSDDSLSSMAICSDTFSIATGIGRDLSADPVQAVFQALDTAEKARSGSGHGEPKHYLLPGRCGAHGLPGLHRRCDRSAAGRRGGP